MALTGSNSYTGVTTIGAGTLNLGNTNALAGGGNITFGGGTLQYSGSNTVDYSGRLVSSGSAISIDTNGQSVTFATGLASSNTGGITKLGTGTLALTGSNSYTGVTTINAGTLQANNANALAGGGNIAFGGGTLQYTSASNTQDWATRFKSSASSIALDTNSQNVALAGVIDSTNTGGLTKSGAGTLTLSGSNGYSGGTTINAGTLKMGNAYAFSGSGSNITVASGATLDAAAVTGTSAVRYNLTLSGSGVLGAGALIGSTAKLYLNSATLTGDTLLSSSGYDFNIDASSGISGASYALTASGNQNINITGLVNVADLIKNGVGQLVLNSNATLGAAHLNNGNLVARGSLGTGTIYLGDTSGANNATLQFAGGGTANPIVVQAGNTGTAIIDNYTNWGPVLSGTMTLNKALTLRNTSSTGAYLTVSGAIVGTGGLTILNSGGNVASRIVLSGSNTFSGNTTMSSSSPGTLALGNVNALMNSTLDTGNSGTQSVIFTVAGTNTYKVGGLQGANDLAIGANSISVGANNANTTYSGAIASTGGGFTKTGTGTLTLSGNNSYSEATTISSGKLVVSGSLNGTTSVSVASVAELNVAGLVNNAAPLALSGTLSGNGSVGLVTSASGSVLSPVTSGNTVGAATLASSGLALQGGGIYKLELGTDGSTGAAGTNWDKLAVSGALDLTSLSSGSPFVLKLTTLSAANTAGALAAFDGSVNHTWSSVLGFGSLSGAFGSNLFTVDTAGFANSLLGGSFQVVQNGTNLDLQFLAVPEPSTWAMLLGGTGMLALLRRRRSA